MSIRRTTTTELPRIPPPPAKSTPGGWQPTSHINQLRPNGAGKDYVNGAFNCGPAVVAMVARGWGRMEGLNDAQLIQQLGKGIVTKEGADAEGLTRMLKRIDVPPAGEALGADYDDADLNEHLSQGHKVIAQVRASDAHGVDEDNAHYVLIEGKTRDGNYTVSDPLSKKPYVVTPDQLRDAVLKAPPDGGMLIPISSPAEGKRPAPPAPAPAPATRSAVPRNPVDTFAPRAPQAKAPNPTAFSVTKDVFEGVDTEFRQPETEERNELMEENEQRNDFGLDIRYSKKGQPEAPTGPVTADDQDEDEFASQLRQRKAGGDRDAYQTLAQLENSGSDKDRRVVEKVKQADKKDPGIGKKTTGSAF
ncbi:cysteine peptidase family C39 domain-containing protein [Hyalangium sp.]|uniref:cysteine peptidase family C39 domain-containing protein n=1 Tax=Hyalangium sp. TaxID=2028555 RepID=UPI002D28A107|nr:papain-like cysteine protease family protein [Hyalangium sp.]HYH95467.1 papain-like cysteine protease family protein [Hyalangium sp.]